MGDHVGVEMETKSSTNPTAPSAAVHERRAPPAHTPSSKPSVLHQAIVLTGKNFRLKLTAPCSTCCELVLPVVIGLLFTWIRSQSIFSNTKYYSPSIQNYSYAEECMLSYGRYAIVPNDATTQAFFQFATGVRTGYAQPCVNGSRIDFFATEAALESGIVFSSYSPTWAYTLRFPSSSVPSTTTYTSLTTGATASNNWNLYEGSGFLSLQLLVDEFILSQEAPTGSFPSTLVPGSLLNLYATEMPTAGYNQEIFFTQLGSDLYFILSVIFMWPFSRMVKMIVEEKTLKLREGMRMMGVRDSALWMSWIFTYGLVYLFISVIVAVIFKINVFRDSTGPYIFLTFFMFAIASISLGFLMTVLFKNTRTTLFMSFVLFIGGYVLYVTDSNFSDAVLRALFWFSPFLMCFTLSNIGTLEIADLGLTQATAGTVVNTISFNQSIGYAVLDTVVYMILTWYLGNVIPQEYGTTRPWWFVFDPKYWCSGCGGSGQSRGAQLAEGEDFDKLLGESDLYQKPSDAVLGLDGIRIRNLRKDFDHFTAVDGVSLDMFEGEVFALLGHNGAGKTTTISMLSGLIDTTSGDARMFGYSMRREMDDVHSIIGVCPQQNVLFDALTVDQHLRFFGRLKNVPESELDGVVTRIVQEVGLTEKVSAKASTLSGGQKRKLCVAIAFIGDPKIVFLDEPTSGMDVSSRRSTWDLIKYYKPGRVIILTTHFMDEADLLGDRIAIMARGKVVCCGSSLFLKAKYGVGYSVVISKRVPDIISEPIRAVLARHVADVQIVNDVGGEIFARMKFSDSERFPAMFRELEEKKEELGVANFGVSVTTLEEVFLKAGHSGTTPTDLHKDTELKRRLSDSQLKLAEDDDKHEAKDTEINSLMKRSAREERSAIEFFFVHFWALLVKRMHIIKRDPGSIVCLTLLPLLLMLGAYAAIQSITTGTITTLVMDLTHLKTPTPLPLQIPTTTNASVFSGTAFTQYFSSAVSPYYQSPALDCTSCIYLQNPPCACVFNFGAQLLADSSNTSVQKATAYGAYMDQTVNFTQSGFRVNVFTNNTATHGLPIYFNMFSNAALRYFKGSSSSSIQVSSKPLPNTAELKTLLLRVSGIIVSLLFNLAFVFVPATYVVFVVNDRISKSKHQQLISGVSVTAYWLSSYLFDLVLYLIPFGLALIIISAGSNGVFTGSSWLATWSLFFLFGTSTIGFSYLLSHLFDNSLTARIVVLIVCFFIGPLLALLSYGLNFAGGTAQQVNNVLIYFYRISPGYNLGTGLLNVALNTKNLDPLSFDVAGNEVLTLAYTSVVYILVVIILEYLMSVPKIAATLRRTFGIERDLPVLNYQEDSDVVEERRRVASEDHGAEDAIQVLGLRKVYNGQKIAVHDLWFGIPKGQCFGFLGINGAGKTTTMEVLTGDIFPTRGTGRLAGFDILTQQLDVRRLIGYCPQFDALFPLLTAREHLYFYARIKGVNERELPAIVKGMLHYLSLEEYADRPAGTYSGGNKRKLCVAIALIGDPPLVFLDEPSTGMDPVARRFMWRFIAETMQGRSVILTTHSMDECEALCHRLGIMVGGRLRCLGTPQHLKNKFGAGWQLDVTLVDMQHVAPFQRALAEMFGEGRLLEQHECVMKLQISNQDGRLKLADVFETVERRKEEMGIREYSVSQTSLEQIFIYFAQQQEEEKGVASGFQGVQGLAGASTQQPQQQYARLASGAPAPATTTTSMDVSAPPASAGP